MLLHIAKLAAIYHLIWSLFDCARADQNSYQPQYFFTRRFSADFNDYLNSLQPTPTANNYDFFNSDYAQPTSPTVDETIEALAEDNQTTQFQSETIEQSRPVPVHVFKKIGIPIPHPVPVPVPQIIKVPVPQPYTVHVPVPQPVQVPIYKLVPQEIEKRVPFEVEKPVPYTVEKPFRVEIETPIAVPISKPYPIHVPVYRHVYHQSPTMNTRLRRWRD